MNDCDVNAVKNYLKSQSGDTKIFAVSLLYCICGDGYHFVVSSFFWYVCLFLFSKITFVLSLNE